MRILACLLLVVSLAACTSGYRHYGDRRYGYGGYPGYHSAGRAYEIGYREGIEHGVSDRRRGYNFNFEHSREFQRGISHDRYINDQFRRGYARGYSDGYYGRRY